MLAASYKKVFPAPTKFRVLIGPLATLVPAELIPRLKPPVAVMIPATFRLLPSKVKLEEPAGLLPESL